MAFTRETTDQLEALSYSRLDDITGLAVVRSNAQWERIVDAVRDQVLFADKTNLWHDVHRDEVIHELADYLVPNAAGTRAAELSCIGAAWKVDLARFNPHPLPHNMWRNRDLANLGVMTVSAEAGRALYIAYSGAVRQLAAYAFELQAQLDGVTSGER